MLGGSDGDKIVIFFQKKQASYPECAETEKKEDFNSNRGSVARTYRPVHSLHSSCSFDKRATPAKQTKKGCLNKGNPPEWKNYEKASESLEN